MKILSYSTKYRDDFKRLNISWINKYFEMEEEDYTVLDNPEKEIIDKGGFIILVESEKTIIGCCALIKGNHNSFQLAKMAIDAEFQGKGGGKMLIEEAIRLYRLTGSSTLYLFTNSMLNPAVNLYKKYGFVEKPLINPQHKRSDLYMELI